MFKCDNKNCKELVKHGIRNNYFKYYVCSEECLKEIKK